MIKVAAQPAQTVTHLISIRGTESCPVYRQLTAQCCYLTPQGSQLRVYHVGSPAPSYGVSGTQLNVNVQIPNGPSVSV